MFQQTLQFLQQDYQFLFSEGTPTIIVGTGVIVPVTGIGMQFDDGTPSVVGSATVLPTGLDLTISLGNMRSTPWANVVPESVTLG